MRFVDSRCIHCGATLRVAQDATHVCCQHCKAELQIVRDGSELTTRLLGEMNENLGQKLDVLRMQNEVERLDREWSLEREGFMVSGKDRSRRIPSASGTVAAGVIGTVLATVMLIILLNSNAPAITLLVPPVFVAFGLWNVFVGMSKASTHDAAEAAYQTRRRALLAELARVQRAG